MPWGAPPFPPGAGIESRPGGLVGDARPTCENSEFVPDSSCPLLPAQCSPPGPPRRLPLSGSFLALNRPAQKVCPPVLHDSAGKGEVAGRAQAHSHSQSQCQADVPQAQHKGISRKRKLMGHAEQRMEKIIALCSLYKTQIQNPRSQGARLAGLPLGGSGKRVLILLSGPPKLVG